MPNANITKGFTFPNFASSNNSGAIDFDNANLYEITLPAMDPQNVGTLTTRTDDDTGVATLTTGHNIVTNDVVDVYWAGGVRFGMVATVTVNAVALEGGAGDVLPAQDTVITGIYEQIVVNPLNLDGDNLQFLAVIYRNNSDQTAKANIDFQDAGSASIEDEALVHETSNGGHRAVYDIAGGDTNNYTGNPVTKGYASHNSLSQGLLYVLIGLDSTP